MNTPQLRRGGGIASSQFIFYLYWYSYIVYFVCDSASEFGAMSSTSFLGFSYPNRLLLFFLVVVVVVFTLKPVLTSIQYPSLSYSS